MSALEAAWPGIVTGKLSDLAGLVFFPLFLAAAQHSGPPLPYLHAVDVNACADHTT